MKTIFQIAWKELKAFFYSPIAWVAIITFVILIFNGFITSLSLFVGWQDMGHTSELTDLTYKYLYASPVNPFYPAVVGVLGIIMPLLTMSIMSRELSSGSIKLLYSSPISTSKIVLGKFVSMVVIALGICLLLVIYLIFAATAIENFDYVSVLPGLLGIFLLICAMSSVGIFISSLTKYQLVAALGTLAIFMLLRVVGQFGQTVPLLRNISFWLAMDARSYTFASGMITSQDLLYFIALPAAFLAFTTIRIDNRRRGRTRSAGLMRYGVVCLALVAAAVVSTLPRLSLYYDATRTKLNTVTQTTQKILKQVQGPVTITAYTNLLDHLLLGMPGNYMELDAQFRPYLRFKPDIKLKYVYYYDTPASGVRDLLERRFPGLESMEAAARRVAALEKFNFRRALSPEEIKKKIDLSSEGNKFLFMLDRDNGQQSLLRVNGWQIPGELLISTAFNRFLEPDLRVGFVEGGRSAVRNGLTDYFFMAGDKTNGMSLINLGFMPEQVSLAAAAGRLPKNMDVLVIADPESELPPYQLRKVLEYMDAGGNLLIACEPGGQTILNPILEPLGFEYMPGRLVQTHVKDHFPQSLVLGRYTADSPIETEFSRMNVNNICVTMPDAVAIRQIADKGFDVKTILTSDTTQMSWTELQTNRFDDAQIAEFNPETGELSGVFDVGVALRREVGGKTQSIVILGDADCFSMNELWLRFDRGVTKANGQLVTEVFRWLTEDRRPLSMLREKGPDDTMKITHKGITSRILIFKWILPGILLCACVIILFRRKLK